MFYPHPPFPPKPSGKPFHPMPEVPIYRLTDPLVPALSYPIFKNLTIFIFRSVTMRLLKLRAGHMIIVICSILTILISGEYFLMRNIFSSTKIEAKELNPEADLRYGPFEVMSPTLNTFNRELWLSGRIQVNLNRTYQGKCYTNRTADCTGPFFEEAWPLNKI